MAVKFLSPYHNDFFRTKTPMIFPLLHYDNHWDHCSISQNKPLIQDNLEGGGVAITVGVGSTH